MQLCDCDRLTMWSRKQPAWITWLCCTKAGHRGSEIRKYSRLMMSHPVALSGNRHVGSCSAICSAILSSWPPQQNATRPTAENITRQTQQKMNHLNLHLENLSFTCSWLVWSIDSKRHRSVVAMKS